jgi:hypothetical protein
MGAEDLAVGAPAVFALVILCHKLVDHLMAKDLG